MNEHEPFNPEQQRPNMDPSRLEQMMYADDASAAVATALHFFKTRPEMFQKGTTQLHPEHVARLRTHMAEDVELLDPDSVPIAGEVHFKHYRAPIAGGKQVELTFTDERFGHGEGIEKMPISVQVSTYEEGKAKLHQNFNFARDGRVIVQESIPMGGPRYDPRFARAEEVAELRTDIAALTGTDSSELMEEYTN